MRGPTPDDALTRLEAEIRDSQFSAWDAEEFLAERHRKKIEVAALPEAKATWGWRGAIAKVRSGLWRIYAFVLAFIAIILFGKALGLWSGLA